MGLVNTWASAFYKVPKGNIQSFLSNLSNGWKLAKIATKISHLSHSKRVGMKFRLLINSGAAGVMFFCLDVLAYAAKYHPELQRPL